MGQILVGQTMATNSEKKQHQAGWMIAVTGLVGGLTSLLGSLGKLGETWQTTALAWKGLGLWLGIPLDLGLLGVGLYLRFSKASLLADVDALRIDPDNPAHLIGRKNRIEQLVKLCHDSRMITLVGESGAGKSAMVRSGLIPELKDDPSLIPFYLDTWGQDWVRGPHTALNNAVWNGLTDEHKAVLELSTKPELCETFAVLETIRSKLGRVPLLIFDQFDDYQARHRHRFVDDDRQMLPTDELININPFWGEVNRLIKDLCVRCLMMTRSDAASGLESVRFMAPKSFILERPHERTIEQLLVVLTKPRVDENGVEHPVVLYPEHGWERLRLRIAADLGEDGVFLPARLRLVLLGLSRLPTLTVGSYERAGGCAGLETGYVESTIRGASRTIGSGLSEDQIRGILLQMVDSESLRTIHRPVAELKVG